MIKKIFNGIFKLLVGYIIYKFLKFVFEIVHIALIVLFVVFGYQRIAAINEAPEEKARGITINTAHVNKKISTCKNTYRSWTYYRV